MVLESNANVTWSQRSHAGTARDALFLGYSPWLEMALSALVGAQTIAVSHRPPMVEAACTLVGAYARPGASGSASLRFG